MNYQEIIDNLDSKSIIALMERLDCPVIKETEKEIIFPTICHNEDASSASHKLYYYKDNHFFFCYSHCQGMSIFKFLENYYSTRNIDYDWYNDIYQVILNCSSFKYGEHSFIKSYTPIRDNYSYEPVKALPQYNSGVLDIFVKRYPVEWLNDGITEAAMDRYNIRYSISQNKIIIPHYDINGNLIGIRGRALNQWEIDNVGKYMPVQIENTWYTHPLSLNLYGLNITKDNIRQHGICFLHESEKATLQADNFELPNCSASVCGSNLNKYQVKLLIKECHPKEIVLCFDNEELPGQDKYFNKLYSICKKYLNYCNFSFIYDRKQITPNKFSPTDMGEDIFRELLKTRVVVK